MSATLLAYGNVGLHMLAGYAVGRLVVAAIKLWCNRRHWRGRR